MPSFCLAVTDDCDSNPCLHGATCNDYLNAYNCTCAPQYEGVDCGDLIPDPCASLGCTPNGFCVYDYPDNKPYCICQDGYEVVTGEQTWSVFVTMKT